MQVKTLASYSVFACMSCSIHIWLYDYEIIYSLLISPLHVSTHTSILAKLLQYHLTFYIPLYIWLMQLCEY